MMGRLYVRTPHALLDLPDVEVAAWTVKDLKGRIEGETSVPVANQRLVYAGRELGDGMLLNDCNLQKEATVNLLLVDGAVPVAHGEPVEKPAASSSRQEGPSSETRQTHDVSVEASHWMFPNSHPPCCHARLQIRLQLYGPRYRALVPAPSYLPPTVSNRPASCA